MAVGVDLVHHHDGGHAVFAQSLDDVFLELPPLAGLGYHHTQVGALEHLPGAIGAQLAEGSHVIDSGRVDEEHRTQGQQLHGFLHGVGGGAGELRDDGHVLLGDGVQQAGLAHVPAAEQAYVQPHSSRRFE